MTDAAVGPIWAVTYLEVAPAAAGEVTRQLCSWRDAARKADGNTWLDVLRRSGPEHHLAMVGAWQTRAKLDAARNGPLGSALHSAVGPHLITGMDTRIHGGLVGGADRPRGPAAVWVVTHVDVPPPSKDACIALLEAQVKTSRAEAGSMRFDVMQQADRPNHFSVVEAWRTVKDYDAHILSPNTTAFRKQLTPLSGALYDERLYRQEA